MIGALRAAVLVFAGAVLFLLTVLSGASGAAETVTWLEEHVGAPPLYFTLGIFFGAVATVAFYRACAARVKT